MVGAFLLLLLAGGAALALAGLGSGNPFGGSGRATRASGHDRGAIPSRPEITLEPGHSGEPTVQSGGYDAAEPTTSASSPLSTSSPPEPTTSTGSYGGGTQAATRAGAEEAAGDYYRAAGVGDWGYTYDHLASETHSGFSRKEWFEKNRWFADHGKVIYYIASVRMFPSSQQPLARVELRLTYGDDSTSVRTTYFVYEDGEWGHRFSQQEDDLFMPDASYGEFVAAQR